MLPNLVKSLFHNLLYVLTIDKLLWLTTTFVTYYKLNIDIFKNRNIGSKHLGGKGLKLSSDGTARLRLNLKATIRKLWSKFGNLQNPGYQSNARSVSSYHNNFQNLNHCDKKQPFTKVVKIAIEVMLLKLYEI